MHRDLPAAAAQAASRRRSPGRRLLLALAVASGPALAGCGEGATGLGLDLVPEEQVQQLGLESWERIRTETPASDNDEYQQTARRVANRLLNAAGADPDEWEVVVFAGDEANAFALPGRKIGIYEGLFRHAQNEAQLAAVIGHEIGHLEAEHPSERVSSQVATETGLQLISAALQAGNIDYANAIAGALGVGAQYGVLLPYSRNQELEADEIGLEMMARAGYDPQASIELWQSMRQSGGGPPEFLSTHPAPDSRIEQLRELLPEAREAYRETD